MEDATTPVEHELADIDKKAAQKKLPRVICAQVAINQQKMYGDLTESTQTRMTYSSSWWQSRDASHIELMTLKLDDVLLTEIENILEAWEDHFKRLATPTPKVISMDPR